MKTRMTTIGVALITTMGFLTGCAETQMQETPKTLNQIVEQGKGPKWLT